MDTWNFKVRNKSGEIFMVSGHGYTNEQAYNNALEKLSPDAEIILD